MSAAIYNNLVECLIKREGPTIFHLGKVQYVFQPRPELTGDDEVSVCPVISQEHRDHLLNDTMCSSYYRKFTPRVKPAADVLEAAEFEEFKRLRKQGLSMDEIIESMSPTGSEETKAEVPNTQAPEKKATGKAAQGMAPPEKVVKEDGFDKLAKAF